MLKLHVVAVAARLFECSTCGEELDDTFFNKSKCNTSGYDTNRCKPCKHIRYEDNKAHTSVVNKAWREANKVSINAYQKGYRETNKVSIKAYREANQDYMREYREANKDHLAALVSKWKKDNTDKCNNSNAKRRAAKLERNLELNIAYQVEIRNIYLYSKIFSQVGKLHVDHIVPLQGELVSGLHVPWNLQVIPAAENMIKSNKYI